MHALARQSSDSAGLASLRARRWAETRVWLIPCVLLLCVTLPHLGDGDWQRGDSGWYTAIGLQAWRTGELWTLMGEPGQPYFNKPPLVFWLTGLISWVFGASAWSVRLPTVFAACVCVLATAGIARELATRRAALASGVVLALSLEFFRRTREVSLDVWQLAFMLLAVWMIARGVSRARWRVVTAAGVPIGLALMSKPFVALLVPIVIAAWLVMSGEGRRLGWVAVMTAVSVLVAGPWHVSMALMHGDVFVRPYFGAEIAQRASGDNVTTGTSPAFYVLQLARNHWPWLVFVVLACVTLARGRGLSRDARAARLAILWTLIWLVALSVFTDRRDRYGLALQPGLALLAGLWLSRWSWAWLRSLGRKCRRVGLPAACVAAIIFAVLPVRVQKPIDPQWPALFEWLEQNDNPQLWQGGFYGYHGSRLYLENGSWPITTRNRWGAFIADPPLDALLIYHTRDGLAPGPDETVVFRSGAVTVTQSGFAGWSPIEIEDPGER